MSGKTLKRLRRKAGLTQEELADLMGVQRNTVTRWEMGVHPISRLAANLMTRIVSEHSAILSR